MSIIETERLLLRPFRESDAADVLEYLSGPLPHCFAALRLDTPDEEDFTEWTLLTNNRDGAFRGFGDDLTVRLGSQEQEMSWDAELGCFLGGGYRLALDQSGSSACLILSKYPA